jgi:archaellum component FlaF (FlaF/FlaG flagellin family)
MISLIVVAIGIIAAMLFGQTTPTKIPNMNFMTGVSSDQHTLYLAHTGGDTLNLNEFSVLLDGVPASPTLSGGGTQWSLGTTLVIPITTMPQNVQIVYNSSGSAGAVLLRQAATVNTTVNVTADQEPYLDCSAVRNWDCADQIPMDILLSRIVATAKERRINFIRNNVGKPILGLTGSVNYHFNITVSENGYNSSIVFGDGKDKCNSPTIIPLGPNDKVDLVFDKTIGTTYFIIYGIAPAIWEMAGGSGDEMTVYVKNSTTGAQYTNGGNALCHTWIVEYSTIDSTMDIDTSAGTGSGTGYTDLIVNDTTILNQAFGGSVVLDNFIPTETGMFLVSYPGSSVAAPVYMIGWANQILVNGVPVTGIPPPA